MRICGITAEYNPFHEGHKYHLAEARKKSGADALVVIMSGHFVQRGEPAIFNPYVRAEDALRSGADAVFMLPPEASTSSAEGFAEYSIKILKGIGCDAFSCGIEDGILKTEIEEIAYRLANESDHFKSRVKELMKTGITYPEALAESLGIKRLKPNSLLAVEYVKAVLRSGSSMDFVPVLRKGSEYKEEKLEKDIFPSSTALRKHILNGNSAGENQDGANRLPLGTDDFLPEIIDSIFRTKNPELYLDCDSTIASRLKKSDYHYNSFEEMVKDIKTKEYTYSRISRAIIHIFLEIHERRQNPDSAFLVGFANSEVLKELKKRSSLTIISKAADYRDELGSYERAAALYNRIYWKKYNIELPNFYRQSIIKINAKDC